MWGAQYWIRNRNDNFSYLRTNLDFVRYFSRIYLCGEYKDISLSISEASLYFNGDHGRHSGDCDSESSFYTSSSLQRLCNVAFVTSLYDGSGYQWKCLQTVFLAFHNRYYYPRSYSFVPKIIRLKQEFKLRRGLYGWREHHVYPFDCALGRIRACLPFHCTFLYSYLLIVDVCGVRNSLEAEWLENAVYGGVWTEYGHAKWKFVCFRSIVVLKIVTVISYGWF